MASEWGMSGNGPDCWKDSLPLTVCTPAGLSAPVMPSQTALWVAWQLSLSETTAQRGSGVCLAPLWESNPELGSSFTYLTGPAK